MAKDPIIFTPPPPNPATLTPSSAAEFARRGWLYFSRQQYAEAKADLETALSLEANVDHYYTLGLILRALGENEQALAAFEHCLAKIGEIAESQRATMLRRLATGQINMIKTGDWNLEKEVWKRIR